MVTLRQKARSFKDNALLVCKKNCLKICCDWKPFEMNASISLKIETEAALLSVPQQHLFWHYCPCPTGQKAKPPEFHLESISADGKTMSGIQTCGDFVAEGTQLQR